MRTPVLAASLLLLAGIAAAEQIVPTPRAVKLPITAVNRPFLEARSLLEPVALGARGYVEEEVLVSGLASLYDWAVPGAKPAVRVRRLTVPYATRVLLRRPADRQKASGRVVVELLEASAGFDRSPLWGLSAEHFLRNGDIWVGVTIDPTAADSLQKFDAVRYAQISFAAPQGAPAPLPPGPPPGPPPAGGSSGAASIVVAPVIAPALECAAAPSRTEPGLAWDILAQVGALLRSSSRENPLVTFDVRRVVAAGQGVAGAALITYVNALHAEDRLGDGQPVFDAFVDVGGSAAPVINHCAAPLPEGDARRGIGPRDVPFVAVLTQADLPGALPRRDDSDAEGDVFRRYEMPGAARGPIAGGGQPGVADLKIAGFDPPAALCVEARSDFPFGTALNAVWQQLDELLVAGTPMVRTPAVETGADGTPERDASGNARGGWRSPVLDVPVAAYAGRSTAKDPADAAAVAACGLHGSRRPLDSAELKGLYGNRAEYLKRYNAAVDTAVQERRLVPADAAALKAQAARIVPAF